MTHVTPAIRRATLGLAAATSLLASPLSHAIDTRADAVAAFNDLATTLAAVANSEAVNKLGAAREKLKDYQFRTVYELTQVSKSPLPGTRLGLQALPVMSQLDAENYLNSLPAVQKMGGIPALSCPVAKMGGAAGRSMTGTLPGTHMQMALSGSQIQTALQKAAPDRAAAAYQTFQTLRDNVCASIYNVAQLSFRIKKFQDLQANWTECATNGIQISEWSVSERFSFPEGIHRTVQAGGGVMFKCGAIYKGTSDDALGYDSWFKFSDDDPVPLNLWQLLKDTKDSPSSCPKVCIPVVAGGSLTAGICMGLDPGISAAGDTVPLRLGVNFHYRSRDKELCTPVINVPAPFGYAQSLGEMADKHKQQMTAELQSQLLAALPVSSATVNKIRQLSKLIY